jgi:hypothetical protein
LDEIAGKFERTSLTKENTRFGRFPQNGTVTTALDIWSPVVPTSTAEAIS